MHADGIYRHVKANIVACRLPAAFTIAACMYGEGGGGFGGGVGVGVGVGVLSSLDVWREHNRRYHKNNNSSTAEPWGRPILNLPGLRVVLRIYVPSNEV